MAEADNTYRDLDNQVCHSSEAEKFPDFSLTSGQFSLTLN